MWLSLSDQTIYFLWSLIFGALLGLLYDIIRAVRAFAKPAFATTIIVDILFFAVCGLLTSLFSIPFNNGTVRFFIIIGEGIGFLVIHLLLCRAIQRVVGVILRILKLLLRKISESTKKFFVLLLKIAKLIVYNVVRVIEHIQHIVIHHKTKEREHEQKGKETEISDSYN